MSILVEPLHSIERGPDVTAIIVNYNTAHLLKPMFDALEAGRGTLSLQVIVIDNASRDQSVEVIRRDYPSVELITNGVNVGFGRANNQALPLVRGQYVFLLNTDAFMSPGALAETVSFMEAHSDCGVLGVKLIGRDGTLQPSCRYFPTPWNVFLSSTGLCRFFPKTRLVDDMSWDHTAIRECDWVPGCYYLIRREVVDQVGLFDPRYFLYYEEVDHCRSVRQAGWSVIFYPFTQAVHIGGESASSEAELTKHGRQISTLQIESELLYFRKHFGLLGLLTALSLMMLGAVINACKYVLKPSTRWDVTAYLPAWIALKLLIQTRLASQPTR